MKLVMLSNFMNHHQLSICNRFNEICDDFKFLCTDAIPQEAKNLRFDDLSTLPYVVNKPENEKEESEYIKLIRDADAVIYGASPLKYVKLRIDEDKLSFMYSERLWKKGTYRRFIPPIRKKVTDKFYKNNKNQYVLSASCFLSSDLDLIGYPADRCYTWGYFSKIEELDWEGLLNSKPEDIHITWVGRFVSLKRCDDVLHALAKVKNDGYKFTFDLVGVGECENEYREIVKNEGLEDYVKFWGALPQPEVRKIMKNSHMLIFSSDFNEGWGAVVNEAMNCLSVPIVSHAAGSSGFLIQNDRNGMLYKLGDINELACKIEELIDNPEKRMAMAKNAYFFMKDEFNGIVAADRLVKFVDELQNGKEITKYESGPLSQAPIIKNNWYKGSK